MAPSHTKNNLDDIKLEDIEFEAVKECKDKDVVKRYIKMLEDDGSYFHELLTACKNKFLELCPKEYYLLYPRAASANEVDDITRDLLDWQESVKETDAALRATRKNKIWEDAPGSAIAAPIRGQEAVVARPNIHRKEEIKDQSQKQATERDGYARDKTKMKDYYSAWDQIDVDAIEQDMDKEEAEAEEARRKHFDDMRDEQERAHRTSAVQTGNLPEGVPEAHRRHLADSEKEKGNEAFYSKDYEEADAYYSRSLHYRADDPSCWANRALARMKLDNAKGALEDCEHALALNPKYMKALHRKGKALYELQRYEEAVRSFQLALMESPGNSQINGDLMIARRKLKSDGPSPPAGQPPPARVRDPRDEPSCVIEEIFDDDEVPAAAEAPSKAPAAGYTRVQIEEDSDTDEEVDQAPAKASFHKVKIEEASDDSENDGPQQGFHKVQIQEESSSEEDEATPTPGFHTVQIVDGSDSEEEDGAAKASVAETACPLPEVCQADPDIHFDDMD